MAFAESATLLRHGGAEASSDTSELSLGIDDPVKPYSNSVHLAMYNKKVGALRTSQVIPEDRFFSGRTNEEREIEEDLPSWAELLPRQESKRSFVRRTLHALQEWEGYVIEILEDKFVARLTDLTASAPIEDEEAVIPLEEISEDDAAKLRLGSIFRWVIGYERTGAGTKRRVSFIVFRDLPVVTRSDLQDGEAWAQETLRSLNP